MRRYMLSSFVPDWVTVAEILIPYRDGKPRRLVQIDWDSMPVGAIIDRDPGDEDVTP